jgi:hypothetical protein
MFLASRIIDFAGDVMAKLLSRRREFESWSAELLSAIFIISTFPPHSTEGRRIHRKERVRRSLYLLET